MSDKPLAHYLYYDLETTGLDFKEHGILTGYFAAVTKDFAVVDELSLKIKPDLTKYKVTQEALDVNKIDLKKHMEDLDAVDYAEAAKRIHSFISKNKPGRGKLKPAGQNIFFDDFFLFFQIVNHPLWEKSVSYARLDTKVCCDMLKEAGLLPAEIGSLSSMAEHFGVTKREMHECKGDVLTTIDVTAKLIQMLKNLGNNSSIMSSDILDLIER